MKRIIFLCFTPYQMFQALYYAMCVKWKPSIKKVLIWNNFTEYHMDLSFCRRWFDQIVEIPNYALDPFWRRQAEKCLYGGRLFLFSKAGRLIKSQRNHNILVCFSDQHIVTHKAVELLSRGRHNKTVLVEEGLHTYQMLTGAPAGIHTKICNQILGIHMEPYIGASPSISSVIVKHPKQLPKQKRIGRKVVRQNNIFTDHQWIKRLDFLKKDIIGNLYVPQNKKIILWIGQPLEEQGVPVAEELRFLVQMEHMLRGQGKIFIKKHPREPVHKYDGLKKYPGIQVVELGSLAWIPLELVAGALSPDIVVSAFSTAAGNLMDMGMQCIFVYCYEAFHICVDKDYFEKILTRKQVYAVREIAQLRGIMQQQEEMPDKTKRSINKNFDLKYLESLQGQRRPTI